MRKMMPLEVTKGDIGRDRARHGGKKMVECHQEGRGTPPNLLWHSTKRAVVLSPDGEV